MIEFKVPGPPVSQGSKNAYRRGGRVVLVETRHAELQNYRARIVLAARHLGRPLLDEPVAVDLVFVVARPKRPKFTQPAVAPDIDKYMRAVFDGLTEAGIWKDDSRAVSVTAEKRYAVAGELSHTRITVYRIKDYRN